MKDEEKAVKLFNGVTDVGDDLIEEAGTVRKRKKITPWRGVAIAACLCLALVGTAAAANPAALAEFWNKHISALFVESEGHTFYRVTGEVTAYDPAQLGPALLEMCKNTGRDAGAFELELGTWEDVKAFMGDSVPLAEPKNFFGDNFHTKVWMDTDPEATGDLPTTVLLTNVDHHVLCDATVPGTDTMSIDIWFYEHTQEDLITYFDHPHMEHERLDDYTMPDGTEAEIILSHASKTDPLSICAGYFIRDGVLYMVRTCNYPDTEEAMVSHVYELLDSFC